MHGNLKGRTFGAVPSVPTPTVDRSKSPPTPKSLFTEGFKLNTSSKIETVADTELQLGNSWEFTSTAFVVGLLGPHLRIKTFSVKQLEREVLRPEAAVPGAGEGSARSLLPVIMTKLLSPEAKEPVAYSVWNKLLTVEVSEWYRIASSRLYVSPASMQQGKHSSRQTAPKRRHHRGKDSESSSDPFDEEEEEEEDDDEDFDEIMQAKIAQMNKAKCLLQDLPARNPLQGHHFGSLPISIRVQLLKALVESRVLDGGIYADVLADMPRELSRIDPVGVDAAGASYYFFAPFLSDFRIYKSTSVPKSFSVCCDSVEDVSALVAQLTAAGDSKELLSALTSLLPKLSEEMERQVKESQRESRRQALGAFPRRASSRVQQLESQRASVALEFKAVLDVAEREEEEEERAAAARVVEEEEAEKQRLRREDKERRRKSREDHALRLARAEAERLKQERETARVRGIRLAKRRGLAVEARKTTASGEELFCLCHTTARGEYVECSGEGVGGCNGWVHPQCVGHEVTMTSLRADETYVCTMCRKVLGLARDELSASDCPEIIRALEAVKCGLFTGYPGAVGPPPDDPPPNPHPQRPPPRPSKKKSVAPETDSQPAPVDAAVALGPPRPQLQQHQHIMPLQYMGQWEQHHATGYSLQYGQPPQLAGPGYLPLYGGTPGYGTQYGPPSYPQPPYYSPVHPFGYPRMPSAYTGYTQLYPHYQHTPPQ